MRSPWVGSLIMLLEISSIVLSSCQHDDEPFQIVPCLPERADSSISRSPKSPQFTPIHIKDNLILNENDSVVLLHGVVLIDPFFLFEYESFTKVDLKDLVEDWNINVIRLPIHPDLVQYESQYFERYVDPIIKWAKDLEVYVLLGYHAHGNIQTGQSEMPAWKNNKPWHGNPYNSDKSLAIKTLREMTKRYTTEFHVIYSIFNEPMFINWETWKLESEELIDTIRAVHPKSILMVSGTYWGYDLSQALLSPIKRPSIIYETHPYPWKGTHWVSFTCNLSEFYPVFLGEWGYDDVMGSFAHPENYALPLLQHTEHNLIGWTAWIYHNEWHPGLIDSYGRPNELGKVIKGYLNH